MTIRTRFETRNVQILFDAKDRFFESNRQTVFEMRAGLRTAPRGRTRPPKPKNSSKMSAESAKAGKIAKALRRIVTVAIVQLPLFRIGEHLVRFADLFEFFGGVRIIGIGVGMILLGETAERFFDFVVARVAVHAEHFIVITFLWHGGIIVESAGLVKLEFEIQNSKFEIPLSKPTDSRIQSRS